jgi:hypothetical protein
MKVGFVRLSRVLGVMLVLVVVIVLLLLGTSSAAGQYPIEVVPKVNVESGGSLSIMGGTTGTNNAIDFGNMGPGQTLEKTLSLGITANNAWHLTVSKNQDLTYSMLGATIPSTNFTFKSNGDAGPIYVTSDAQFGGSGTPTNVVSNGSATTGSGVNVVYKLTIPAGQPCNDPLLGYYSAVHTYTLIVGSP